MAAEGGMILGGESTSHANGGVKYVVKNTGKLIEAEGDEFVFCSEVTKSTRRHTFTGTPYEILIALAKEYNCNVGELKGLNGGEFVICKKVVRDREPLTVSGTPTEIISYLQVEKGCNPHWSYDLEKQDGDVCQSCEHDGEKKGAFRYNKEGIAGIEGDGSMAKGGDVKAAKKKVFPSSFKASARFLIDAHYHRTNTTFFGKPYLVHAEVKGSGKFSNQRFGHAWVEDDDLVYNFSRGKVQVYPKAQFYTVADVQTSDSKKYKRYSYEDVAEKLLTSDVYCWDLQTIFEKGGEVMEFYHPDDVVVAAPAANRGMFNHGGAVKGRTIMFGSLPEDMQVLISDFIWDAYGDVDIPDELPLINLNLEDIPVMVIGKDKGDSRDEEYVRGMVGDKTPPIVYTHGVIIDGRHRTAAKRKEGKKIIEAIDLTAIDKDGLIAKDNEISKVKTFFVKPDYRALFQERMIAAQDLAKQLRAAYNGRLQINSDGSITLYHLTGEQVAGKIRENGFRAGTYFFASKSSKYNGDTLMNYRTKHEGYVIMEVHVSPYDVSFSSGTGEFYAELPMKMDSSLGFYKSAKEPEIKQNGGSVVYEEVKAIAHEVKPSIDLSEVQKAIDKIEDAMRNKKTYKGKMDVASEAIVELGKKVKVEIPNGLDCVGIVKCLSELKIKK